MAARTSFDGILARLAIAIFLGSFVAGIAFRQAWETHISRLAMNAAFLGRPAEPPSFGEFVFRLDNGDQLRIVRLGCVTAGAFVFAITLISAFRIRDANSAWAVLIANVLTILFALFVALVISLFHTPILFDQGGH